MHKYRFDVVVNRVPDGNPVGADRGGYPGQESIPYLPCRFFRRKAVRGLVVFNVPRLDGGRNF